jgi:hypothetical protein
MTYRRCSRILTFVSKVNTTGNLKWEGEIRALRLDTQKKGDNIEFIEIFDE